MIEAEAKQLHICFGPLLCCRCVTDTAICMHYEAQRVTSTQHIWCFNEAQKGFLETFHSLFVGLLPCNIHDMFPFEKRMKSLKCTCKLIVTLIVIYHI